jgi:hypothetical protein
MPHSNASASSSSSSRTSMQQPLLERDNSPPPHARQQWYEQAAAEAARQGQEELEGMQQGSGSEAGDDVPFVLLHGIGMGLIPYISLLFNMAATGEGWRQGLCVYAVRVCCRLVVNMLEGTDQCKELHACMPAGCIVQRLCSASLL